MPDELGGVRVYDRVGAPIGHIAGPEHCAVLCSGSRDRIQLFMAAIHSISARDVNAHGVAGG